MGNVEEELFLCCVSELLQGLTEFGGIIGAGPGPGPLTSLKFLRSLIELRGPACLSGGVCVFTWKFLLGPQGNDLVTELSEKLKGAVGNMWISFEHAIRGGVIEERSSPWAVMFSLLKISNPGSVYLLILFDLMATMNGMNLGQFKECMEYGIQNSPKHPNRLLNIYLLIVSKRDLCVLNGPTGQEHSVLLNDLLKLCDKNSDDTCLLFGRTMGESVNARLWMEGWFEKFLYLNADPAVFHSVAKMKEGFEEKVDMQGENNKLSKLLESSMKKYQYPCADLKGLEPFVEGFVAKKNPGLAEDFRVLINGKGGPGHKRDQSDWIYFYLRAIPLGQFGNVETRDLILAWNYMSSDVISFVNATSLTRIVKQMENSKQYTDWNEQAEQAFDKLTGAIRNILQELNITYNQLAAFEASVLINMKYISCTQNNLQKFTRFTLSDMVEGKNSDRWLALDCICTYSKLNPIDEGPGVQEYIAGQIQDFKNLPEVQVKHWDAMRVLVPLLTYAHYPGLKDMLEAKYTEQNELYDKNGQMERKKAAENFMESLKKLPNFK